MAQILLLNFVCGTKSVSPVTMLVKVFLSNLGYSFNIVFLIRFFVLHKVNVGIVEL